MKKLFIVVLLFLGMNMMGASASSCAAAAAAANTKSAAATSSSSNSSSSDALLLAGAAQGVPASAAAASAAAASAGDENCTAIAAQHCSLLDEYEGPDLWALHCQIPVPVWRTLDWLTSDEPGYKSAVDTYLAECDRLAGCFNKDTVELLAKLGSTPESIRAKLEKGEADWMMSSISTMLAYKMYGKTGRDQKLFEELSYKVAQKEEKQAEEKARKQKEYDDFAKRLAEVEAMKAQLKEDREQAVTAKK